MNNNIQPFFPTPMNYTNMGYNQDIRNLENRVCDLEKEVIRLRNKIERIENTPIPLKENYTSNYHHVTFTDYFLYNVKAFTAGCNDLYRLL